MAALLTPARSAVLPHGTAARKKIVLQRGGEEMPRGVGGSRIARVYATLPSSAYGHGEKVSARQSAQPRGVQSGPPFATSGVAALENEVLVVVSRMNAFAEIRAAGRSAMPPARCARPVAGRAFFRVEVAGTRRRYRVSRPRQVPACVARRHRGVR